MASPPNGPEDEVEHDSLLWRGSLFLLLTATAAYAVSLFQTADPDLWGHLRFGQLIDVLGYVPRSEPYSYLSRPLGWINHEWLSELLFAKVFDAFGSIGLSLIPVVLTAGIIAIVFLHLRSRSLSAIRSFFLSLLSLAGLIVASSVIRPHLFTFLFFTLVCLSIFHYEDHGRQQYLLALPLLFPLWAGFHGGFLAGLGVLLIAAVASGYAHFSGRSHKDSSQRAPLYYGACLVVATILAAIGPYGIELLSFLAETATVPRPEITEWDPVSLYSPAGLIYLVLALATLFTALASSRSWRPVDGALILAFVLLPLTAVRHVPLLGIGFGIFVAPTLGDLWQESGRSSGSLNTPLSFLNLAVAGALIWRAAGGTTCIEYPVRSSKAWKAYPKAATERLATLDGIDRLAVHFNWGEWIIWHLGPQVQVSVDGRRETVYSDSIYELNRSVMAGTDDWHDHMRRLDADAALYPSGSPTANLLATSKEWQLVYEDSTASLYLPNSSTTPNLIERMRDPRAQMGKTCFPDGRGS